MDGDTPSRDTGSGTVVGRRRSGDRDPLERAGRLTTTIPRPAHRTAAAAGGSRLAQWLRGGGRPDRISSSRRTAWLFGLAALVIGGAVAAALFVLPVRAWFFQDDRLRSLEHQIDELRQVNRDLQAEVDRLQTQEGMREAARDELGQIEMGDQRQTVAELPPLPREMPAGWPYSQVDQILNLRAGDGEPDDNAGSPGEPGQ